MQIADEWSSARGKFPNFADASRKIAMARGVGLPGRVWETAQPLWIADVASDSNFPRASAAAQDGIHTALGFPATLGTKVLGSSNFSVAPPDIPMIWS